MSTLDDLTLAVDRCTRAELRYQTLRWQADTLLAALDEVMREFRAAMAALERVRGIPPPAPMPPVSDDTGPGLSVARPGWDRLDSRGAAACEVTEHTTRRYIGDSIDKPGEDTP